MDELRAAGRLAKDISFGKRRACVEKKTGPPNQGSPVYGVDDLVRRFQRVTVGPLFPKSRSRLRHPPIPPR
jgi:hypothetical protein